MALLRTSECEDKYQEYRKNNSSVFCSLCTKESIKLFKFWKIIKNDFPYDRIAKIHNMIIPVRHVTEEELNQDEIKELKEIKSTTLNDEYEFIIEATNKVKSIPQHFHLHLIVVK